MVPSRWGWGTWLGLWKSCHCCCSLLSTLSEQSISVYGSLAPFIRCLWFCFYIKRKKEIGWILWKKPFMNYIISNIPESGYSHCTPGVMEKVKIILSQCFWTSLGIEPSFSHFLTNQSPPSQVLHVSENINGNLTSEPNIAFLVHPNCVFRKDKLAQLF